MAGRSIPAFGTHRDQRKAKPLSSPGPQSRRNGNSGTASVDFARGENGTKSSPLQSDDARTTPPPKPAGSSAGDRERSRFRWHIAAAVALLWIAGLILLAVFTANPVTLNRDQVLRSEAVITGQVVDAAQSLVKVERVWRGDKIGPEIRVENLSVTGARGGDSYIFPLSIERSDGRKYRVTESLLPNAAPLIYPATPESAEMLSKILGAPADTE